MLYNPKKQLTSLYQICHFSCGDGYHTVRKVIVDEMNNIVEVKEKNYRKKKIDKFLSSVSNIKYKIYSTHDIQLVGLPDPGDILAAKSQLLNNDNNYSGFAGVGGS